MSGSCVATKFIIPTAQTRLESAQQSLSYLLLFLVIHFLIIIALQNLNNAALNLSISGSTCKVYQSVHIKLHHTGIFCKPNDFLSLNKKIPKLYYFLSQALTDRCYGEQVPCLSENSDSCWFYNHQRGHESWNCRKLCGGAKCKSSE